MISLCALQHHGGLDSMFGSGGKVETMFGPNLGAARLPSRFQPNGGSSRSEKATLTTYPDAFAIAPYNTNGTLDTNFGPNHNGLVTTDILGNDHRLFRSRPA